uniref:Uncharacterized protein n=1 Tax=Ralstonia solanacearum TaxID=305 RepID=A0A0S4TT91_RALSL|nr:protein of unknown function [Ralstonia solanacearum]
MRGRVVHQDADQLGLNELDQVQHLLDHLAGQVLEILRHQNLHQLLVGVAGLLRHVAQEAAGLAHQVANLLIAQPAVHPGLPAPDQRLRLARQGVLHRARRIDGIQGAHGRLLRHVRDVVQPIARVGNGGRSAFDAFVQAQFTQAFAQHAGQVPDPLQHVWQGFGIRGSTVSLGGTAIVHFAHQASAFSHFSKILFSFSPSVAAVNGLTT